MFVVIGCPVYEREWILPDWFEAICAQDFPLEDLGFVFEVAPGDEATIQCLLDFAEAHPNIRWLDIEVNANEAHYHHPEGGRHWDNSKYQAMVRMRNRLLDKVTCRDPDRYFSLDSDILLENPSTISALVELTETRDAVSPLLFMTPEGWDYPSVMTWVPGENNQRGHRQEDYPLGSLFQADIIMAAVMMSRPVYQQTRYQFHRQGEDLGWSADCKLKGFNLYSASYIYCPHIMSKSQLAYYKREGDSRQRLIKGVT